MTDNNRFTEFLSSNDTMRIYKDGNLVFSSKKNMLLPLVEYINTCADGNLDVTLYDKIIGNAAALLAIKAHCSEVHSPIGSEAAIKTMDRFGVKYELLGVVSTVQQPNGNQ